MSRPWRQPVRDRWWRPLLELLLFAALVLVLGGAVFGVGVGLAATAGVSSTDTGLDDPVWDVALGFALIAAVLPAVALTVRWAGRRTLGTVSSVAGRLRWRWLLRCLAPAMLVMAVQLAVGWALDPSWSDELWPGWRAYAAVVVIAVLVVPLQSAAEEYMTRGWLVQTLVRWTRVRWVAAALASLVFVALHGTLDPWIVADLTVFAAAMCWLTFRTGGLEAAIVLHAANNMTYLLAASLQGVPDLAAAVAPARAVQVLPSIVAILAYCVLVARRWSDQPHALVADGDHVAALELPPPPRLDAAVDGHRPLDQQRPGL